MTANRLSRRMSLLAAAGLLLVVALSAVQLRLPSPQVEVDFIDVGQGDSILLRDGNGFDVLIDGGRSSAGPTVLAYLRAQGIANIDVLVATHADADHVGGLIDVLEANDTPVSQVLYNGYPGTTQTWVNFATAVSNEGMTPAPAQFPAEYVWGGMTAHVLNPVPGLVNPDQNNASVVLLVDHGTVNFMLTGDIDSTQEAVVMARGTPIAAEILKVGHHGSRYSSGADFLAAVQADEAVISVGPNSYGHPTGETLARLAAAGAAIWRTDQAGTVTVISDGSAYTINGTTGGPAFLVFLPLVIRQDAPTSTATATATQTQPGPADTPTNTATATSTATSGPTQTQPPQPASLSIMTLSGSSTPEYVTITNNGGSAQDMTGWTIVSVVGPQTFNFPGGYVLGAGASVRVESYTGASNNPPTVLLWSNAAIWNNSGDKAELRSNTNALIDSKCYGGGCP